MQALDLFDIDNFHEDNSEATIEDFSSIANERTIGWSSTCLDQTINYYIDCNISMSQNKEKIN